MYKYMRELVSIGISVVGAGYILMTVTGDVLKTGILLTVLALALQISALFIPDDKEKDEE